MGRATCSFNSWRTKSHMPWLTTTAPWCGGSNRTQRSSPGEFGSLSWISPEYSDSTGWHGAVAREPGVQAVRTLDFDGNVSARVAMRTAMERQGTVWDAGVHEVANWQPAPREGISTFLDQLGPSSFTTVCSTWRPEDEWTEAFAMMVLTAIPTR